MFNMIKMELYRLIHTRSAYVIWIVLAATMLFTNMMTKDELQMTDTEVSAQQEVMAEDISGEEAENIGLMVTVPTGPGEKVTVFDMVYGNVRGKILALFLVIFSVMFAAADFNGGYVKNIGGQVRNRAALVVAKGAAVMVYAVATLGFYVGCQAVWNQVLFGYVKWGDGSALLTYLGIEMVLHCALSVMAVAMTVLLKSSVLSMTIGICCCMNVQVLLYRFLDRLLAKAGVEDVQVFHATVIGNMIRLPMSPGGKEITIALTAGAVFLVVALAISGLVFQKRDI